MPPPQSKVKVSESRWLSFFWAEMMHLVTDSSKGCLNHFWWTFLKPTNVPKAEMHRNVAAVQGQAENNRVHLCAMFPLLQISAWANGQRLPSLITQHRFINAAIEGKSQMLLCDDIDEASPLSKARNVTVSLCDRYAPPLNDPLTQQITRGSLFIPVQRCLGERDVPTSCQSHPRTCQHFCKDAE